MFCTLSIVHLLGGGQVLKFTVFLPTKKVYMRKRSSASN